MAAPRSALVTGITGQDGGYLTEQLLAEGTAVHGLVTPGDPLAAELLARSPQVQLHEGDLLDEASLAAVVAASAPDEVYNLAGISSVAFSWEQPVRTADITALGAGRLLEVVRQHDPATRFVQASSGEVFGEAAVSPQDESTPLRPNSPYGAAKAYAHHLVGVYRGTGMHAVSVLLYNHESPRRPPAFVTRKITRAAARISQGRQDELVLGNMDVRRDWGWAPDYVDGLVRALRHDEPQDYVLATGQAHTVRDFVTAAFARVGIEDWSGLVRVDPAFVRPADIAVLVGDATRAREVLGWSPTVAFDELVARMVEADLQS